MTRTVGVSDYWFDWLNRIVASRIRKSKSEIVEEGLKAIQRDLDQDADSLALARERVRNEEREESESNE